MTGHLFSGVTFFYPRLAPAPAPPPLFLNLAARSPPPHYNLMSVTSTAPRSFTTSFCSSNAVYSANSISV